MKQEWTDIVDELEALKAERDALREALTPSAETKAAYIGEASFPITVFDEDAVGRVYQVIVPWTTTKGIMKMISARAALK